MTRFLIFLFVGFAGAAAVLKLSLEGRFDGVCREINDGIEDRRHLGGNGRKFDEEKRK